MANTNQEKLSILRRKQVEKRTGLSRSTIYLRMQEGTFPKPINLGARAVGWLEHEINSWLASRSENRDNGQPELEAHHAS
ncbi:MAG: AlpA family transcriptional regulator [Deltaproteobacteria bacterium]|nr:AlpA family transcriptional regulator [Deltaproteobacteria bacterium]